MAKVTASDGDVWNAEERQRTKVNYFW